MGNFSRCKLIGEKIVLHVGISNATQPNACKSISRKMTICNVKRYQNMF